MQASESSADAGQAEVTLKKFECSVDSTQACNCDAVYAYVPFTKTGTYTIASNQITFKDLGGSDAGLADGGVGESVNYCVTGNTLTFGSSVSDGSPSGYVMTLTK